MCGDVAEIDCCCTLYGTINGISGLDGQVNGVSGLSGDISSTTTLVGELDAYNPPTYHGEYEVTPSLETQTLRTQGKLLSQDVVVNPIPEYYGLITWDGSVLTVS